MFNFANLPLHLWAKFVSTTYFDQNQSIINKCINMTPYEAMNSRKPSISFFHIFGYMYFIKKNRDQLTTSQPKSNEAIFIGYSSKSKAFRVLNRQTRVIEQSFELTFDDHYIRTTKPIHVTTHIM